MNIIPFTRHTTIHNTLQASKAVEDTYDYYYATDSFMDQLMLVIMQQGTVFAAMQKVREINALNGYKVVSDYDVAKIKIAFKESQNRENKNGENKRRLRQRGFKYQNREGLKELQKEKYIKDKYKQLQLGYMRLLSNY